MKLHANNETENGDSKDTTCICGWTVLIRKRIMFGCYGVDGLQLRVDLKIV